MFAKVLVANRGEIACRIIKTLREMGIVSVAVYSDADADAEHVSLADEAYPLGPAPVRESYLNVDALMRVMQEHGVEAVHPGYGFLSENVAFSSRCEAAGIVFIGPENAHILDFGLKHRARAIAEAAGVPLVPGSGLLADCADALAEARRIGYPVMLKSTAGGGGIGMRICRDEAGLTESFDSIRRMGENYFNDAGVFLEKYIETSRHIEVQIFGNGRGGVAVLGERDCSVQRRNQKVVEETPAPGISDAVRAALHDAAKRLAETVAYRSAGTVEFIYDVVSGAFYFLEVNTRLQVEHGVTETVFHVDLVRWMIELAAGRDPIAALGALTPDGCAMEFRLYAEDPGRDYRPSSGTLTRAVFPAGVRCDTWVKTGTEVSAFYDPLLAKIIVGGKDRAAVIAASAAALAATRLDGFETNLALLRQVLAHDGFIAGAVFTGLLKTLTYRAPTFEVLDAGAQTTVQDVPGRTGYWGVGVPPSGPMDALNFRLANRLVGNPDRVAALEMTLRGGTYRFNVDAEIALAGGAFDIDLNGRKLARYEAVKVAAGDVLRCGKSLRGQRLYLAVRGGLDVPEYMGSRATFILGRFGGHAGRALVAGDVLHIGSETSAVRRFSSIAPEHRPPIGDAWEIAVMVGPHGAPDYLTENGLAAFFAATWKVHFNSSRTGVRLVGPRPEWARADGGEAGLHPSNIHDNAYAVGAVDFTGDMPVILGPDGPSLGGFVCPVTVVDAELWKVGQLRPGDTVTFVPVTLDAAAALEADALALIETGTAAPRTTAPAPSFGTGIVAAFDGGGADDRIVCRQSGDKALLMEFGEARLDLKLRFTVHAWFLKFEAERIPGILDLTPGIRSLQIHFDSRVLPRARLLGIIESFLEQLKQNRPHQVEARIVHLPLSWDDPATRLAIEKYTSSVRKDAPWCPSNIEFIRRINGLDSVEQVKDIVFNASYLVMGLGDVYLGAPVATPLDPRHRLVTTKYNPARTWTPENAVGIGGAYLCVYGMEGPGGYQFVGRTVQMWNRYNVTREFEPGKPWLLRCFDQLRFYPVSAEELLRLRRDFIAGRAALKIEKTVFDIQAFSDELEKNRAENEAFKRRQQQAFDAEYRYWVDNGLLTFESDASSHGNGDAAAPLEGAFTVSAPVAGNVWKSNVAVGDRVTADTVVAVLESMKTEISVVAGCAGKIAQVFAAAGDTVDGGQLLYTVMP
ncbi:MAG: urea carboxylase [Verrucomicrobiota bacterium]|jgi:urea carboxylase|nr:urea carboxylase [Verrucomicrobiota bacterium]